MNTDYDLLLRALRFMSWIKKLHPEHCGPLFDDLTESPTCAPCNTLKPLLKELCAELSIPVVENDVSVMTREELGSLGIRQVPTVVIRTDLEETNRFVGMRSKEQLREILA